MQTPEYKHICGYPLKEDNNLTRCPGCGGKITPWNTQSVVTGSSSETTEESLCTVATWLVSHHRGLAAELAAALKTDLQAGGTEAASQLRRFQTCLAEKLKVA